MDESYLHAPAPVWRPQVRRSPANQVIRLDTSPMAIYFDWHRAFPDPSYDPNSATMDSAVGREEFQRVLQPGPNKLMLADERITRRYYGQGTWEEGGIVVAFDQAQTPLSIFDWIIPRGGGNAPPGAEDGRVMTAKEVVTRGGHVVDGVGKVTTVGPVVTGEGTSFLAFFAPADVLNVNGESLVIAEVQDDNRLILSDVPSRDYTAFAYAKGVDRLLYPPVSAISHVHDDSKIYRRDYDYRLTGDDTIQWLTHIGTPGAGRRYGVIYSYRPKYEILDLGSKEMVVYGVAGLTVMAAGLWKPENLKS